MFKRPQSFRFYSKRYGGLILSLIFLGLVLSLGLWYAQGPDKWRIISALPGPVRKVGKFALREAKDAPYLADRFGDHGLPEYDIQIKEEDLNFLNNNLPAIGETLTDQYKVYVPAKFSHDGKTYEAEVRYRGATSGHWAYPKKSLRVRFDKKQLFQRQPEINLIIPLDRAMVGEEMNHYRARKLGLLTPDSRFVVVRINGRRPAAYWEAEQMGKEFLERHGMSGDTNLYGDQYLYQPLYTDVNYWRKYANNPRQHSDDYTELAILLDLLNQATDEEFHDTIFNILDKDSFYSWTIWSLIAGSSAQGSLHNMRLYLDPSVGKLKIAAWDLGINQRFYQGNDSEIFEETDNPLALRILSYLDYMAERNERLGQFLNTDSAAAELNYLDETYNKVKKAFYQDRIKEYYNSYFDDQVRQVRATISGNYDKLRDLFLNANASCRLLPVEFELTGERVAVELVTRTLAPLTVDQVELISGEENKVNLIAKDKIELAVIKPTVERLTRVSAPGLAADISFNYLQKLRTSSALPLGAPVNLSDAAVNLSEAQYFDVFALRQSQLALPFSLGDVARGENDKIRVIVHNQFTKERIEVECRK